MSNKKSAVETNVTCKENERVIKLNVGGSSFCTTFGTLKVLPYFEQLFANEVKIEILKNGEIFIDRDGDLFSDILEYLRSFTICNANLDELKSEAKFYQLESMINLLDTMRRERKIGKRKEFKLVSLTDLEKISSLCGGNDKCVTDTLSSTYEFISVVKFDTQSWHCSKHGAQHPVKSCQDRSWVCPTQFRFEKGQEKRMLLVAKIND